jgi:hypothetical protein
MSTNHVVYQMDAIAPPYRESRLGAECHTFRFADKHALRINV